MQAGTIVAKLLQKWRSNIYYKVLHLHHYILKLISDSEVLPSMCYMAVMWVEIVVALLLGSLHCSTYYVTSL